MKIERLDIVIAVIAGITCLGGLIKIPVWALFIARLGILHSDRNQRLLNNQFRR